MNLRAVEAQLGILHPKGVLKRRLGDILRVLPAWRVVGPVQAEPLGLVARPSEYPCAVTVHSPANEGEG
jgi:hypothetical protein